jgi:hypothetical protein
MNKNYEHQLQEIKNHYNEVVEKNLNEIEEFNLMIDIMALEEKINFINWEDRYDACNEWAF